jgi:hypothetical protein
MTFEFTTTPAESPLDSQDPEQEENPFAAAEVQRKVVNIVVENFENGEKERQEKEQVWLRCFRAYNQYIDRAKYKRMPWRSKLPVGWSFEAVEAFVVEMMDLMFPDDVRFFKVGAANENDAAQQQNSDYMTRYMQYKYGDMDFITTIQLWLKQLGIIGNSALKVYWRKDVREGIVTSQDEMTGEMMAERQEIPVYDAPYVEVIDMKDFIVYPAANARLDNCMLIHRIRKPLDEVKQNPMYSNTDQLTANDQVGSSDEKRTSYKREVSTAFGIDDSACDDKVIELLEAWGDFVIEGVRYRNYVATVANGRVLLRFQPNPYELGLKPFVFTTLRPVPNQNYGLGIIEPALSLHSMGASITNMMLDNMKQALNGQWKYEPDGIFLPAEFMSKPGALHAVADVNNLVPLENNANFPVGFQELNTIKGEFEQATSVTQYSKGSESVSKNRTAREAMAIAGANSKQFVHMAKHLNRTGMEKVVKLTYLLLKQFEDPRKILDYVGWQPKPETPMMPQVPMDQMRVHITGLDAAIQQETAAENIQTAMTGIARTPAMNSANWPELTMRLLKSLNIENPEGCLLPKEITDIMQNVMVAQAAGVPPQMIAQGIAEEQAGVPPGAFAPPMPPPGMMGPDGPPPEGEGGP